jgi:hypothetical protein
MNPDVAWGQAIMKAHTLGLPDMDKYAGLQGDDRIKMAQMIVDNATTTKDRFKADMAAQKEKNVNDRFKETQQRLKDNDVARERNLVFNRDLATKKYSLDELKANFSMENKTVEGLSLKIKEKQDKIDKLRKGDYITDEFGMVLEGPERQREAVLLGQEIKALEGSRDSAQARVNAIKPNLPKGEAKDAENKAKADISEKNFTAEDQALLLDTINKHPTKAAVEHIKKKFQELHPGLKFEDYVKLDTSRLK